ncbi:lipase family protein [Nocardia yamanashiensis]|uniref:lipase family protein n=1 Tax=Nocardia yamanashiensis TaxID=209247 RepID=UPI00083500E0|nr:lipase family protein [Nocardia yamanashiensis]
MLRSAIKIMILVLTVAASAALLSAPAGANPLYPTPDPDPFFQAPSDLADKKPGDVVRVRRIDPGFYVHTDGWQVAFRSTNSAGNPIMGMTTVLMPQGVKNPPLVSYQALINSLGTQCSPSRSLFNGELQDSAGAMLPIGRGWAISMPDYLGPTVAYGAAKLGGMVTLDSVKAVKQVSELGLADVPTVLAGYSGGGMATSWAGAMQPTYAPDLKLTAVVAGGIPADLREMALALGFDPHPGFGLAFAAAMGLEREYPDRLPVSDQLNENGLWFRDFTKDACRRFLLFHGVTRNAAQLAASRDMMSSPEAHAVLRENSLRYSDLLPTVPTFFWQGRFDTMTFFGPVEEVAQRYCQAGVPLTFKPYEIAEHLTTAVAGFPEAWEYVEARFRGDPVTTTC